MKTPLNYQITEYDCAPTSVLNAIAYLFDREEIQPDIPKFVSLYTLDTYGERGLLGKEGTSKMAMQFLCAWLNQYSEATGFAIETEYLSGENVAFNPNSKLVNGIADGGVAVVRVMDECWHYVLSVGIEK
ncbi:MAG: peptidase C39, partial [Christensenellaceae bacterium]|nr:peptidase C39 [Christensenellaceae bacterium]